MIIKVIEAKIDPFLLFLTFLKINKNYSNQICKNSFNGLRGAIFHFTHLE